jgi:hypothetical protein
MQLFAGYPSFDDNPAAARTVTIAARRVRHERRWMNPIPTGGRATSPDRDDPEATEADDPAGRDAGPPPVPAPRSGDDPLPQRGRPRARGAGTERAPDGRPYAPPDAATLNRLLTGLRDI